MWFFLNNIHFSNPKAVIINSHCNSNNLSNCNALQSLWVNINYSKKNYEINFLNFFGSYAWWSYFKSFNWSPKLNVHNICKDYAWEHLWMAASVKCPLKFPLTALLLKDINIRGYFFVQLLANLSQFFFMIIVLFSFLLINKSPQNMPDIKSAKACPLKLVNIVKLFTNILHPVKRWNTPLNYTILSKLSWYW